jgi:hypothetical protein
MNVPEVTLEKIKDTRERIRNKVTKTPCTQIPIHGREYLDDHLPDYLIMFSWNYSEYIIDNFTVSFLSIFLPLFSIASVIFLIKLATYTAIIHLSIWEMIKLYIFVLPEILFFTLPLTFFIAATLTLFKLSNDNEMIVFF